MSISPFLSNLEWVKGLICEGMRGLLTIHFYFLTKQWNGTFLFASFGLYNSPFCNFSLTLLYKAMTFLLLDWGWELMNLLEHTHCSDIKLINICGLKCPLRTSHNSWLSHILCSWIGQTDAYRSFYHSKTATVAIMDESN